MLYLIDRPLADVGFRVAGEDDDARIVLLQDGVLCDPPADVPAYAVRKDVEVRGADLPPGVEVITYNTLVDLLFDHEVKSFV